MINAAPTNRMPDELSVLVPITTPARPSTELQISGTPKQIIIHRTRLVRDRNQPVAFKSPMALTIEAQDIAHGSVHGCFL